MINDDVSNEELLELIKVKMKYHKTIKLPNCCINLHKSDYDMDDFKEELIFFNEIQFERTQVFFFLSDIKTGLIGIKKFNEVLETIEQDLGL